MTEAQLRALGPALSAYLDRYLFCCGYTQTFAHLNTYVRGLLSDLERKTCEPIALKAGTPVRSLQEFLRDHLWDFARVRDLLGQHTAELLQKPDEPGGLGTVGIIDETSAAKKGDKTPGVQRQHLGCLGKIDNGIVTVHLGSGQHSPSCITGGPRRHQPVTQDRKSAGTPLRRWYEGNHLELSGPEGQGVDRSLAGLHRWQSEQEQRDHLPVG